MIQLLVKTGCCILAAYAVIVAVVYVIQDSLIFFPQEEILQTPADKGLDYRDITLQTSDNISIAGWYVRAENERGTVLFCHGNAGNISHRLDTISIFNSLKLSVLIFDYRGYGKSGGRPSERGTYLDAQAAWDYLVDDKRMPASSIVLFGRSLGAAIAAELALRESPACLVIESGFTSVTDMGKRLYPWLPVGIIAKHRYATLLKIGAIACPKLIIHSPDDDIVPFRQGRQLYDRASPPREFLEISGGHNDGFLLSGRNYTEGLETFLQKYLHR